MNIRDKIGPVLSDLDLASRHADLDHIPQVLSYLERCFFTIAIIHQAMGAPSGEAAGSAPEGNAPTLLDGAALSGAAHQAALLTRAVRGDKRLGPVAGLIEAMILERYRGESPAAIAEAELPAEVAEPDLPKTAQLPAPVIEWAASVFNATRILLVKSEEFPGNPRAAKLIHQLGLLRDHSGVVCGQAGDVPEFLLTSSLTELLAHVGELLSRTVLTAEIRAALRAAKQQDLLLSVLEIGEALQNLGPV